MGIQLELIVNVIIHVKPMIFFCLQMFQLLLIAVHESQCFVIFGGCDFVMKPILPDLGKWTYGY
jgi:hypothetical protein